MSKEELLERLEALRERWALQAYSIEKIYGEGEKAAKALRQCIGDLGRSIQAEEE